MNFGPHLRDAEGKIAAKGEPGYVSPKDRKFADQRAFVLPEELRQQNASELPDLQRIDDGVLREDNQEARQAFHRDERGLVVGDSGEANHRGAFRPEVQLKGARLDHAVEEKSIDLVHFSSRAGLEEVSPKFFGEGKATPNDQRGAPASFFFVKGSKLGGDRGALNGVGASGYTATVDGGRIYDADADALGYWDNPNRVVMDEKIQAAGYSGMMVSTPDGRDVVKLWEPVKVTKAPTKPDAARAMFRPDTANSDRPGAGESGGNRPPWPAAAVPRRNEDATSETPASVSR